MCYMTTTITVYTALSSILPSIISFSIPIPNAPIVIGDRFLSAPSASMRAFKDSQSSATVSVSLLPPPYSV